MDDKLQEIEHKFERLEADLGDPGVLSDPVRFRQTAKERSQLQPLVEAFRELKRVRAEVAELQGQPLAIRIGRVDDIRPVITDQREALVGTTGFEPATP